MAEALAKADGEQDMEKKIEAALACPCLGALPQAVQRSAPGGVAQPQSPRDPATGAPEVLHAQQTPGFPSVQAT